MAQSFLDLSCGPLTEDFNLLRDDLHLVTDMISHVIFNGTKPGLHYILQHLLYLILLRQLIRT